MIHKSEYRIHCTLHGRVQGVGFRWFVLRVARDAGLRGWVRNNPDGSVEVEAAGDPEQLAVLRERIAVGPRGARVERVVELAVGSATLPDPFEIE
jgi:acylphosphatase